MASMERRLIDNQKHIARIKFAIFLNLILACNKRAKYELDNPIDLPSSLRKLEAVSEISYPILQKCSVAKNDIHFTTTLRIIEALGVTLEQFVAIYTHISEEEITTAILQFEEREKSQTDVDEA